MSTLNGMARVGALLLVLAVGLIIAFNVIGSRVDGDGILHEAFVLVPIAWLSGLAGAGLVAVAIWRGRRSR